MGYNTILYDVEDGILTLTLNRPKQMNAFTVTMLQEMLHVIDFGDTFQSPDS